MVLFKYFELVAIITDKTPFDGQKYMEIQRNAILERLSHFSKGKLYFEIGGKLLYDRHAASVLPGFDPESKIKILKSLGKEIDILFCVSSPDIANKRIWKFNETYEETVLRTLHELEHRQLPKPKIIINMFNHESATQTFAEKLQEKGFTIYYRYLIPGYPKTFDYIVSKDGFGKDQYVETKTHLIIVTGLGSNSGKMSTCLGQIYLDKQAGLDSGYAKYETFPIWDLPLDHPVNIAYEAATIDIGDYNVIDRFFNKTPGTTAVNYNRDVEAFPILEQLIKKIVNPNNYMTHYHSPTDMGINTAKQSFVNEEAIIKAAINEITDRIKTYEQLVSTRQGKPSWVLKCKQLLEKAKAYQQ